MVSAAIAEVEQKTSGEIRVVLRHVRHKKEKALSLHELALHEFHHLGMEKTQHRTGILILILFAERKFHIIADEGIHAKVDDGTWDKLAGKMSAHFKNEKYRGGIIETVREVGSLLARHFPRQAGDADELPNDVIEE